MSARPDNRGRRRFVNWLLGTSAGGLVASILYPIVRFIDPPRVSEAATNEVEAGTTADDDLRDGHYKIVRFGDEPVILIHVEGEDYRAFSATCTHLDCIVDYRPEKRLIWCWCHNGVYDLQGRNIGGPPPRPLTPFTVHLVDSGEGRPKSVVVSKA